MKSELATSPLETAGAADTQEGGLRLDRVLGALRRQILVIVGVTTATASLAVFKAVTDTPVYQAGFELLTNPVTLETQIISGTNPQALSNQTEVISVSIDEAKLKVLTSPRVIEPVVEELQDQGLEISYGEIVSKLTISPNANSDILTVLYRDEDPEKVKQVLDLLSETFLQYSLESRQSDILRGIAFVDEQIPDLEGRVQELEEQLESLRQQSNIIDPTLQGEQLTRQAAALAQQQLDLRIQLEQAELLYQDLQSQLAAGNEAAASSLLSANARYQAILDRLLTVDSQLAQESALYLDSSLEMQVIRDQRDNLIPLLEEEGKRAERLVQSSIRELNGREQTVEAAINLLNQQVSQLSTITREYNDIQRKLAIADANLSQFLSKREALRIDAAQRQAPWELLTAPGDPYPSVASAKRNLILGTALGLLLGTGIALGIDRLRGRLYSIQEFKEATGLPLLGSIPYENLIESGDAKASYSMIDVVNQLSEFGLNVDLLAAPQPHRDRQSTPFFEAFRSLYTNIRLNNPDQQSHIFAIGSAIPNMGKTTVCFYLGLAAAAMGRRVLIVDTDLRRPSLHRIAGIENTQGLSNFVAQEVEAEDIIRSTPAESALSIVTAGAVPPDPTKVLTSKRMKEFFRETASKFDLIVYDTCPILGFADPMIVAAQTQGLLLVGKLGEFTRGQLEEALDELRIASVPVFGAVANGVKSQARSYSYYQYYQKESTKPEPKLVSAGMLRAQKVWQGAVKRFMQHPLFKR